MRLTTVVVVLLLCGLPATALVRYQAASEMSAMGGPPQKATASCWLAADRMRVEGTADLLLVRADRSLVWLCDRKAKTYREYTFDHLRRLLPAPPPAASAPRPQPLGTRELAGRKVAGNSLASVSVIVDKGKQPIAVTWMLDLWVATDLPEASAVYEALNARLAAANLPLVALRGALAVAEPKPHPLLAGYAQAMAALSAPLAEVKGIPVATEVLGAMLPPGMENLPPAQRAKVLAEDESVARLLVVKTQNTDIITTPDDPTLFEIPRGFRKAG